MKKYTVKELAHLLDNDNIGIVFTTTFDAWSNPEMFDNIHQVIDKYGDYYIKWITFNGFEDDIYQAIELEDKE